MENDDLSRFEKVLDDKNSSSSKFFMPDNFYDEKADAMRDSSINSRPYVGDPALKPKEFESVSINGNNVDDKKDNDTSQSSNSIFDNLFKSNNNLDENNNILKSNNISNDNNQVSDLSKLLNPQFIESNENKSVNNSNFTGFDFSDSGDDSFKRNLNTDTENFFGNSKSMEVDNNSLSERSLVSLPNNNSINNESDETRDVSSDFASIYDNSQKQNDSDINMVLNNVYGVKYSTDESLERHELYDDLKPVKLDGKSKNDVHMKPLDSNFTKDGEVNHVDKTLSSHKEFSKIDLSKDDELIDNSSDDIKTTVNFSYHNQWADIPKTKYKASSSRSFSDGNLNETIKDNSNVNNFSNNSKQISSNKDKIVENLAFTKEDELNVEKTNLDIDNNTKNNVQAWINKILKIDSDSKVKINPDGSSVNNDANISVSDNSYDGDGIDSMVSSEGSDNSNILMDDITKFSQKEVDYDFSVKDLPVHKSDLLEKLTEKAINENKISILARYGEDFCNKDYVTNPAIGRSNEIRQLILILLTPEKSGILVGKPGIGKTSIAEGLAYQLQRDNVPDTLKGYTIVNVKTASLLGTLPSGETRLQTLVDELKTLDKVILFIDEIHMLIGATNESALDFANMFKEGLGRGKIKVIGATTTEEYERYILRDKAFVRRFQKVEVLEPSREHTIRILMGTLPKIEKNTGAKLKYDSIIQGRIMGFIVDITSEYKRIYGIGSRYPDICLTLLSQAFSQAVFENRKEVTIFDIRNAISNSKNIYPDVIKKELVNFDKMFVNVIREEQGLPPLDDNSNK